MLRIGGRELRHEGFHRALLADDLVEALRAQELHDGLREMDLVHALELLALLRVLRRLGISLFLLEDLQADVLDVVLVLLLELVVDLFLDGVLDVLARHLLRNALGELREDLRDLVLARRGAERRVLEQDALEREHAVRAARRAHERERSELAGLQHEAVGAHRVDEHGVKGRDLTVELRLYRVHALCLRFLLCLRLRRVLVGRCKRRGLPLAFLRCLFLMQYV